MIAVTFALVLAAQVAPAAESTEVDPVLIQPRGWLGGPVPTEMNVIKALNELTRTQPDRVVCIDRQQFNSRRTRVQCATLQTWYDMNMDRNLPGKLAQMNQNVSSDGTLGLNPLRSSYVKMHGPPYELVNMVTQRYRDPKLRARIMARKAAEARAASAAEPPISNP